MRSPYTAHTIRADCTLVHLPPEQCQSINHMQSCAADLNDAYAASCCHYTSHMGAYAKCPCLEKDLQTSVTLMVPPYTVCCTTAQNLGAGKNRSALRSSVLSCRLEEHPENHRHKKTTKNYLVCAVITR